MSQRDWNWQEPEPPPAAARLPDEDMQQMANENRMDEESEQSASTEGQWHDRDGQWPDRGVRYLENGTMREYVENGQRDHQRYMWRRNQPETGYPWYWERHWNEVWREGRRGDGAVFHVNSKGTDTESWWQSPRGEQFGHMETEHWAPQL